MPPPCFFVLTVEFAGGGKHLLYHTPAQPTITAEMFMVFPHIEVHTPFAHISKSCIENLLHQLYLFHHMSRGQRLDTGTQHIQRIHCCMITVGVILSHFHRLELLQTCFLGNLVLALVCIVFQMSHVRNITHITHLVSQMFQVAVKYIECDSGAGMTQMSVSIYRGTAHIHSHMPFCYGLEQLLLMRKSIVNQ